MKTILFIRHAKSSWANIGQADFDRPLNERGQRDAAAMAQKLLLKNIGIDSFVTSSALRAKTTCMVFAKAYEQQNNIVLVDKLYHALPHIFFEVISQLPNNLNNVAIFAHNPGISEMVGMQILPFEYVDMPTCAVFAVQANISRWQDYEDALKVKLWYTYPKKEEFKK